MARLTPFIAKDAHVGQQLNIWAKIVFFVQVGNGTVKAVGDFDLSFDGRIDTIFYKGDLRIGLELLDHDPNSATGPCQVLINGARGDGSYTVEGEALRMDVRFREKQQSLLVRAINDGRETEIVLWGEYNQTVHLAPA